MELQQQLISELIDLLGKKNVLTDATALSVYECDAAPSFKALPDVVVFADTTQQVSDIVKLANRHRYSLHRTRWWYRSQRRDAFCSRGYHHCTQSDGSYLRGRH